MKTALIIYWSKTGNTEKVANVVKQGLEGANIQTVSGIAAADDST